MKSILPDPEAYTQAFYNLVGDKTAMNAIYNGITAGEEDGLNEWKPGDLSYARGMLSFLKRDSRLRESLAPHGWRFEEKSKQRRILAPEGLYGANIQLLHARAYLVDSTVHTRAKGSTTVRLVNINYQLCSGQRAMELFDDADALEDFIDPKGSIWAISTVSNNVVYPSLVLPEAISDCRKELYCRLVCRDFEPYVLTDRRFNIDDLPQGVDVDFPSFTERIDPFTQENEGEPEDDTGDM